PKPFSAKKYPLTEKCAPVALKVAEVHKAPRSRIPQSALSGVGPPTIAPSESYSVNVTEAARAGGSSTNDRTIPGSQFVTRSSAQYRRLAIGGNANCMNYKWQAPAPTI